MLFKVEVSPVRGGRVYSVEIEAKDYMEAAILLTKELYERYGEDLMDTSPGDGSWAGS